MGDPYTDAASRFTQKQREIAGDLIMEGMCQPDAALDRAKSLAQAYFAKRATLEVVADNTTE